VRPLAGEEKTAARVDGGLLVLNADGAAARAGIEAGDIILAVNGQPTASVSSLRDTLKNIGRHAAILIQRDDARIFIPIDLG
jgi:serine protease Do